MDTPILLLLIVHVFTDPRFLKMNSTEQFYVEDCRANYHKGTFNLKAEIRQFNYSLGPSANIYEYTAIFKMFTAKKNRDIGYFVEPGPAKIFIQNVLTTLSIEIKRFVFRSVEDALGTSTTPGHSSSKLPLYLSLKLLRPMSSKASHTYSSELLKDI
ncbi:hypothetical protein HELRODRAFT_176518 [Helobdella robusta]|uniref:Uncharacterized protein n=1 Tax=Helobdella robusta TaxID=6412 RepID=T1FAL8_HELRO|nr:hypothetical protein HELRODRAFT_176518 [Helobdella robusta]ESN99756.1 hypothetical protein HELRODRAFT_176518 [Helobdella robusta]